MKNIHQRQGDLLLIPTESIPKTASKSEDNIVLEGEATGHHHRLQGGDVYKTKEGSIYFTVSKKATLVHEEHSPIEFRAGKYAVLRQREYVSENMTKIVID